MTFVAPRHAATFLLAGLAALLAAGCDGLGNGRGPVSAVLQPLGGLEGAATAKAFTCVNTGVQLFVDFTDGQRGDFTGRATFTSSNPAVARVSNQDIPVPEQENVFFNRGTIVPVAPGTTTITARYLSFTNTITYTVGEARNLRITPASADLAVNSRLDLSLVADLDGVETAVDAFGVWAFVAPNTAVATISTDGGVVTGLATGTLQARARIPGCPLTAEAPVAVANLQSLALTKEFPDTSNLIVATSERLTAIGTLDNGRTQDLTGQVTFTSADPTAIGLSAGGVSNLLLALRATGPVQVGASFANPAISAPPLSITPVADGLNSLSIEPATVDVMAGETTTLKVFGSFASGARQEITRHVGFVSSEPTTVFVQTSGASFINVLAGLVSTSLAGGGKSVTVTANSTSASSQAISATATVNVRP